MDLLSDTTGMKPKSFWERKEGTTGMVVSALLVAGLGMGLYKLLPFLVSILQNAVLTVVFGLILAGLLYVITNKRFRTVVSYMFQSAMRKLTSAWATVDPIGILKNYYDNFVKALRDADEQLSMLFGRVTKTRKLIEKNEQQKQNALELLAAARRANNQKEITLKALEIGRLDESNGNLSRLANSLQELYDQLLRARENTDTIVRNLASEITIKEEEYVAMKAGYSAMAAIRKIMNGQPDERMLFDEAMRFLADDYAMKLGGMQDFLRASSPVISAGDLQNSVYVERALQMLDGMKGKSPAQLAAPQSSVSGSLLDGILDGTPTTPVKETVSVAKGVAGNHSKLI